MYELLKVEKYGQVGVIVLDNPKFNILSNSMIQEIYYSIKRLEQDAEVNAIVLTGKGHKVFIAGADIKKFPDMIGDKNIKQQALKYQHIFKEIESVKKPTIAVLNGLTLGGGLELALTFDLRIAESHSQIGLPEVSLGILPGWGGTQRLPRLVGEAKAKEMMFTGEAITAAEALKIGLVNHTVPTGEGQDFAMKLAEKISGHSLTALTRVKESVNRGMEETLEEGLEIEAQLFSELFFTEDVKEGVQAFLEKRTPFYSNK